MKLKLNWGHYITIAMVLFMGFILYMVFSLSSTKVDLHSEDYYQQELDYEQRIQAASNGNDFDNQISVSQNASNIVIMFNPELAAKAQGGSVHFYKPNDSDADKMVELNFISGGQVIDASSFAKGNYVVKFQWNFENKNYYVEKQFTLN
jgi:hypothetical protein